MSASMSRRELLRMIGFGGAVTLLAACQPKVVEVEKIVKETVIVEKEVTAAPAKPTGPQKVTFWGWWQPRMDLYENAAKSFMAEHPEVEIEVQTLPGDYLWSKVLPATAAGTGPTILKQKPREYFPFVVNELLEAYPDDRFPISWWKENFSDTWEIYAYEGKVYVYVAGSMANLLMYNRRMFENVGLDPQMPPQSWGDLISMGKKLTEYDEAGNILVVGLILGEYPWINAAYQLGSSLVEIQSDGTRKSAMLLPEPKRAFKWLVELYTDHRISSREFLGFGEAIGTEKAAMGLMTSWITGTFDTDFPDTAAVLGWAPPPTPSGKPDPVYGYKTNTIGLSVFAPKPAPEKDAAFAYIEHLLKHSDKDLADIGEMIGSLPGKVSVRSDPRFQAKEALRVAVETLPKEKSSVQESSHLDDVRNDAINRVVMEGMSIEESLAIADEEWNGWLGEGDAAFMA